MADLVKADIGKLESCITDSEDAIRRLRHLQLSNIMRTVTKLYLYYVRKSSLKTGIHIRTIM